MRIEELFKQHDVETHPVVKFNTALPLDLGAQNEALSKVDLNNEASFDQFIFNQIASSGKDVGIGGYGEVRSLYSRSELFEGEEPRTIHLGIDIWSKAGTPVYCPFQGEVHSFANRNVHGDYGPVIILRHKLMDLEFHTLYGHLSKSSIENLSVGQKISTGDQFAFMGTYEENFHWPPHLHFQLIRNMQGYKGDYPGVCKSSGKEDYLTNCPDPSFFIY
ncbi:peptidoglycan DD-metalloendopeptidase family protein [Roseivirga misakiensis]|uniref:Peptidase M23 n=1 Tax=Roseivirga misakiensis TaxID=1563681 RepID=A0A1E5SZZ4_9BACT|nr:peptidoglycan DD-metalloendopeptidase family protein [Roseivirga misakiensis]OEK04702.1 peptidase M23 [Roseivirga misakiensis]